MTDYIEITPEILTKRALRQMRTAANNLHRAGEMRSLMAAAHAETEASGLLNVLANSINFYGVQNRGQVERALAYYFDALEREN